MKLCGRFCTGIKNCIKYNLLAMANFMILFWVGVYLTIVDANAAGEFNVLHNPDSLIFTVSNNTLESLLKDIISVSLGLPVDENIDWKGLYVTDPFNTPEAVVDVYIDGISSLNYIGPQIKTFPLTIDEYEQDIYETVQNKIKRKFPSGGNNIVNMKLSEDKELTTRNFLNIFGEIKFARAKRLTLKHLKYSEEEDYHFLNELASLKAIAAKVWAGAVIKPDNILDFYNFRFSSLHSLLNFHGVFSPQTEEAKNLLKDTLEELNKAFVKAYDDSVLVTTIVTNVAHKRSIRAANETDASAGDISDTRSNRNTRTDTIVNTAIPEQPELKNAAEFNPDYPAMFNIIFWFGVMFFFVLVSLVYFFMDMDPGRDSIIYRMTTARVKKDN